MTGGKPMTGLCRKEYLELIPPTEDDSRSAQVRVSDALAKLNEHTIFKKHPPLGADAFYYPSIWV